MDSVWSRRLFEVYTIRSARDPGFPKKSPCPLWAGRFFAGFESFRLGPEENRPIGRTPWGAWILAHKFKGQLDTIEMPAISCRIGAFCV